MAIRLYHWLGNWLEIQFISLEPSKPWKPQKLVSCILWYGQPKARPHRLINLSDRKTDYILIFGPEKLLNFECLDHLRDQHPLIHFLHSCNEFSTFSKEGCWHGLQNGSFLGKPFTWSSPGLLHSVQSSDLHLWSCMSPYIHQHSTPRYSPNSTTFRLKRC